MIDNTKLDEEFGKIVPLLLSLKTRELGYKKLAVLADKGYDEANILLGQYHASKGPQFAIRDYEKAAKVDNPEGWWGLSGCIEHNFVPNPNNENDNRWVSAVLKAAELGCPDAMNEAGNIENRRNNYFLSSYWYTMAWLYEHQQAAYGLKGISNKWAEAGSPDIPQEHKDDPCYIQGKLMMQTIVVDDKKPIFKEIFNGSLNNDYVVCALYTAKASESGNDLQTAYMHYLIAANKKDLHAIRCVADMLMTGSGCHKDEEKAKRAYKKAAERGERNACFVMGEFERINGNQNLANAWYAKAFSRGLVYALQRIK